jgi:hypothetical protein
MRLFLRRCAAFATLKFLTLLCSALAIVANVEATTLIVTTTADSGAGSLRDTIAAAGDGDTIQFDAALNGQTIILTTAELVVSKDISITGPGPNLLAVEKSPTVGRFRIFHVMPGHIVAIEGLTIRDGNDSGGGVRNDQSTLTIHNCTVFGNFDDTTGGGGGIANYGASAILTISNSTVNANRTAGGNGGGIWNNVGRVTIINSIVSQNLAPSFPLADGGGIWNNGMMEISKSTITTNHAGLLGGGILNSGTLTVTDSTVVDNLAGTNAQGSGRGGGIHSSGTLQIINSTISGNRASGKNSGLGGGLYNNGGATLEITDSTLSGNTAVEKGGGIYNFPGNGTVEIANSTLSGNSANDAGGGIYNGAIIGIGNTILNAGMSGANIFNNTGTVTSRGYNLSSDDGAGFLTGSGDQVNTNPMLGPLQNNGGPTLTHLLLTGSPAINAGDPNFSSAVLYDQRGPGYARVFSGRVDIGSLELQPTPTPTPIPTATPSPTPSPTSTPSPTPPASPTPTATPASLGNISTRLRVETGDNVLIGGFIITGNMSKKVVLRGIGPSLGGFGLSDPLADPTLELRGASGALIFQNDDWQDNSDQAAQLNALGLAPPDPKESGIVATLTPAAYTAVLAGKNNGVGVGLVEIYDTSQGTGSQLANISTRGFVRTGNNVMIGGFILGGGSNETRIVVRGIGPSLAQFGLSPVLTDPTLELRNADGALLLSNDDWQDDSASAAQLVSRNLAPQHPKESGIFALLPPGAFTAILAGKSGGTGIGLVEIYNVN